jgi:hypothetical protein
MRLFLSEH